MTGMELEDRATEFPQSEHRESTRKKISKVLSICGTMRELAFAFSEVQEREEGETENVS